MSPDPSVTATVRVVDKVALAGTAGTAAAADDDDDDDDNDDADGVIASFFPVSDEVEAEVANALLLPGSTATRSLGAVVFFFRERPFLLKIRRIVSGVCQSYFASSVWR